jgi:hypothetical protein
MSKTFPATAVTSCPFCGRLVEPAADSTWVIAWYTCRCCGDEWSARLSQWTARHSVGVDVGCGMSINRVCASVISAVGCSV